MLNSDKSSAAAYSIKKQRRERNEKYWNVNKCDRSFWARSKNQFSNISRLSIWQRLVEIGKISVFTVPDGKKPHKKFVKILESVEKTRIKSVVGGRSNCQSFAELLGRLSSLNDCCCPTRVHFQEMFQHHLVECHNMYDAGDFYSSQFIKSSTCIFSVSLSCN